MSRCHVHGSARFASTFALILLALVPAVFAGIYPSPINIPVTGVNAIAAGDFNGDGKMDIVVADGASSTVEVLLNSGTGSAASSVSSASGVSVPASLVVGDFNGDGKLDIALHNKFDLKIVVLLGNGDGTFQAPVKTVTTSNGRLVVGDFNNDGHPDLATGNQIFLGKGDGTFQSALTTSYGGTFYTAADLNGDGNLDLLGIDSAGISVLLGIGDGSFGAASSTAVTGAVRSVAVADMNGDRKLDVIAGVSGGKVLVLLGNGDGTLQTALTQTSSVVDPYEIAVADFTADGLRDVIVAGGITEPVSLLAGSGTGSLDAEKLLALGFADNVTGASLATADFDGNGTPDLVAPSGVTGRVVLWLSKSTGGFATPNVYPYSGGIVASADFNGDARPDAIFAGTSTGKVGVMLDKADGTLAAPIYTTLTTAPLAGMVPADLNADGLLDLVFWTSAVTANNVTTQGATFAALGRGDGTFDAPVVVTQSLSTQAVVKDLNGDGFPDVADLDTAPGNVAVFLGKGDGTFGYEIGYPTAPGATFITAADVNGDGHPDLITAGAGGVDYLPNNGDGTYAYYKAISTVAAASVALADVDGDGKLDLVIVSGTGTATTATVYLGSGTGTFTQTSQIALGGATRIHFADINNDGLADIVADEGSATGIWLNTKAGTFAKAQDLPLGGPLELADINTDGLPDLLQVSGSRSYWTLAYNQFGTTAAGDFSISAAPVAPSVAAGDKTTVALTLGSLNGYAGIVALSCSGLPAYTTCVFSPVNVTIPATAASATLTIQTSLNSVSALRVPDAPRKRTGWTGFVFCGVLLAGASVRRRRILMCAVFALLAVMMMASCSSPNSVPPIVTTAPKSVTTTITILASAGTTVHSTQIALTITK